MNMNEFKNSTQEIKHYIISLLSDNAEHTRSEMYDYVKKNVAGSEVKEGVYTGAVKCLLNKGVIEAVGRGTYKMKGQVESMSLTDRIIGILENCKGSLNAACNLNLLEVTENELKTAKQVKDFIGIIEKEVKKYSADEVIAKDKDKQKAS